MRNTRGARTKGWYPHVSSAKCADGFVGEPAPKRPPPPARSLARTKNLDKSSYNQPVGGDTRARDRGTNLKHGQVLSKKAEWGCYLRSATLPHWIRAGVQGGKTRARNSWMGSDSATFHTPIVRRSCSTTRKWGRVTVCFGDELSKFCEKQLLQTKSTVHRGCQKQSEAPKSSDRLVLLCIVANSRPRTFWPTHPPFNVKKERNKQPARQQAGRPGDAGSYPAWHTVVRGCTTGGGGASSINPSPPV